MKRFLSSLLGSMLVFGIVETLFVLFIFHEIHFGDLATVSGLLHVSYWLMVFLCGWMRSRSSRLWIKTLCTGFPVIYHVVIHVLMSGYLVYAYQDDHDHRDEMLIVLAVVSFVLIGIGEYVIHRWWHCVTHHDHAHQHCHDRDCTDYHKQ